MNQNASTLLDIYSIPVNEDVLGGSSLSQRLEKRGFYYDEHGRLRLNANIFVAYVLYRIRLIFCKGIYYIYHRRLGKYQEICNDDLLRITRDIIHEAQDNLYHSSFSNEYIRVLRLETPQVERMNPFKHLINVKNGMLNILTGELLPHSPEYYSTVQLDLEYAPEAEPTRFLQYISEITLGDEELANLLQEIVGYILSPETRIQKAFFLVGGGSNGKGILTRLITLLVGEQNVSNLTLSDFGDRFRLANLVGKAVNIAAENEVGHRGLNSERFKQLVAGDDVVVERKYQEPCSFTPTCKFLFAVNSLPRTTDHSHGLYRRLLLIPFDRQFRDEEQDKTLIDQLKGELPGILNWALKGLNRLMENDFNFTTSEMAERLLSRYKQEQNPLLAFVRASIDSGSDQEGLFRSEIRKALQVWCTNNGTEELMKLPGQKLWPMFKSVLENLDLPNEEKQYNGNYRFKGLKWKGGC
ncbi:phage/plasmid primase, P4 family [Paenibacillus sp. D51F]